MFFVFFVYLCVGVATVTSLVVAVAVAAVALAVGGVVDNVVVVVVMITLCVVLLHVIFFCFAFQFDWSTSASFGRGDQVDGLPRPYKFCACLAHNSPEVPVAGNRPDGNAKSRWTWWKRRFVVVCRLSHFLGKYGYSLSVVGSRRRVLIGVAALCGRVLVVVEFRSIS